MRPPLLRTILPLWIPLLVLGCFGTAGPGSGRGSKTWWVATVNSTGKVDGRKASPFLSIGDALDKARDGDTIRVTAGTYAENLVIDQDVVLLGDGPEVTIVQGDDSSRVITVQPKTRNVRLEGFTVQGGYSSHSSALFADQAGLTIRRCLFTANATGSDAAGSEQWQSATVRLRNGTYRVDRCVFFGNTGSDLALDAPGFCAVVNSVFAMSTRFGIHIRGNTTSAVNDATLTNVTIYGANDVGLLMDSGANARFTNVLEDQCGIGFQENPLGGDPVVRYCSVPDGYRDHDSNTLIADPRVLNSLTPPAKNVGNLMRRANLRDPAGGDFRLAAGSPCIDRGDPAIRDADGSRSDLGAFGGPQGGFFGDFSFLTGTPFPPAASVSVDLTLLEDAPPQQTADADGDGKPESWSLQDGRLVRRRPGPSGAPAPVPPYLEPIRQFRLFDVDQDGRLDVLLRTTREPQVWLQRKGPARTVAVRGRVGDRVEVWQPEDQEPSAVRVIPTGGDRPDGAILVGLGRQDGVTIRLLREGRLLHTWQDVTPEREDLTADD